MFERIVNAKATGSTLEIVSAFEPVNTKRLREEIQAVPGDVPDKVSNHAPCGVYIVRTTG